jgi:hypothetical protein
MSKMKKLDEIAEGVAEVTMELMHDTIDWQMADFDQDGDDYGELCLIVLRKATEKMYKWNK